MVGAAKDAARAERRAMSRPPEVSVGVASGRLCAPRPLSCPQKYTEKQRGRRDDNRSTCLSDRPCRFFQFSCHLATFSFLVVA